MLGKNKSTKAHERWLKGFGKQVESVIRERGYESIYDFWIQRAGDDISRATLNYIVAGKVDPKASTIRTLAKLLEVTPGRLFDFE